MSQNPLLSAFSFPPFDTLQAEHMVPAVTDAIQQCRETVECVLAPGADYNWQTLCQPLSESANRLHRILSPIAHLNAVMSLPAIRAACENCLGLVSEYQSWLSQHQALYQAFQQLRDSTAYAELEPAQQRVVDHTLRDFRLAGGGLSAEKKQRFTQINRRLTERLSQFSNNELDATMHWSQVIDDQQMLAGLPASVLSQLRARAQARGLPGWLLTLDAPCYVAVMTWAHNRDLRETLYRAYTTRASDQGPDAGRWDNSAIIDEVVQLRHELARLTGFEHFAQQALVPRMVETVQQVSDFLLDLAQRARPQALQQRQALEALAQEEGIDTLQPWDVSRYSELLKQRLWGISDEQTRPWFPEARVLEGIFHLIHRLFGVTAQARHDQPVWHPDVRLFSFYHASGELCGSLYLDLYARDNKRGGAWMDDCATRLRFADGRLQSPIAWVVCNFLPPQAGQPAQFTHGEVVTLFHEFGHALHHILTTVEVGALSGINGVPWDAVELPSQMLENWCWQPEALALLSGHYQHGEPLPQAQQRALLAARTHHMALWLLRYSEMALFDLRLHSTPDLSRDGGVMGILQQVRREVAIMPVPEWGRLPHAFSHIFPGGYAAGYYSYLWANVLAMDAFGRFREEGVLNSEVGAAFLQTLLSQGGSQDPQSMFRAFRGRAPHLQALLHGLGIVEPDEA